MNEMSTNSESSTSSNDSIAGDGDKRQITPATSVSEDDLALQQKSHKRSSSSLEEDQPLFPDAISIKGSKRARIHLDFSDSLAHHDLTTLGKVTKPTTSLAKSTLENILKSPIVFAHASALTRDDEIGALNGKRSLRNLNDEHESRRQLTLNIPSSWPKGNRGRPAGLQNAHNFCYRRSVLQAFFHAPVFCNWLQLRAKSHAFSKVHKVEARCLICDFDKLVTAVWTKSGTLNQSLRALDAAIKQAGPATAYPWTANISQADAHEFMSWLVDRFEHKAKPHKLAVEGLFKLRVLSEWTCQDCHEVHTSNPQDETGLSISLSTKNPASPSSSSSSPTDALPAYISRYFTDELTDARCANPSCQSLRNRPRTRTIASAPEVLFVQLQRFESSYNRATRAFKTSKITRHVPIPEFLDLSPFAADAERRKRSGGGGGGEGAGWRYRLSSVVAHAGTLKFGHYVAFAAGPDGRVGKFDDDSVGPSSLKEMMRPEGSFTPYILTYLAC